VPLAPCVAPKLITSSDSVGWQNGYVAWWGYENTGSTVDIPVGANNGFDPAPVDRQQPVHFPNGKVRLLFPTSFTTPALTWTLSGVSKTAVAASTPCGVVAPTTINAGISIYISSSATQEVRAIALRLSDYLNRITGYSFPVVTATRPDGISVGIDGDFDTIRWPYTMKVFDPTFRFGKQDYIVATQGSSPPRITIAGATTEALSMAVWEFLYQLGYRQWFPGSTWEVVPRRSVIQDLNLNIYRRPAFLTRDANVASPWKHADDPTTGMVQDTIDWVDRNQGVKRPDAKVPVLATTPAWNPSDVAHQRTIEYWRDTLHQPLPAGLLETSGLYKLCVPPLGEASGTSVYAMRTWANNDTSFNQHDFLTAGAGGGAWNCADNSWTPSDRLVYLSNALARDRQRASANDDMMVGFHAYSTHVEAPVQAGLSVERNTLVAFANSYPAVIDQLAQAWRGKGATLLGVRDTINGDQDKPHADMTPTSTVYATGTVPRYGGLGAVRWMSRRLLSFQASGTKFYYASDPGDIWGDYGLMLHAMFRTLLTGQAVDSSALAQDFAVSAFNSSAAPYIQNYLAALDSSSSADSVAIGDMYRALNQALPLIQDTVQRARLRSLVVYPRFRELIRDCRRAASCAPGTAPANALAGFAYATRFTRMIDAAAAYAQYALDDSLKSNPLPQVGNPTQADWNQRLDAYLESLIAQGAAAADNQVVFSPAEIRLDYHDVSKLVPANVPAPSEFAGHTAAWGGAVSGDGAIHLLTWSAPAQFSLTSGAGEFPVTIGLYGSPTSASPGVQLDLRTLSFDQPPVSYSYTTSSPGLHRVDFYPDPGSSVINVDYPIGERAVAMAGFGDERSTNLMGTRLFFYVPKNTAFVGGVVTPSSNASEVVKITRYRRINGVWTSQILSIPAAAESFKIAVDNNTQGQIWAFTDPFWAHRHPILLTVPPQLARWPDEFLLPSSVVASDGLQP
jgi:hypothetical protein